VVLGKLDVGQLQAAVRQAGAQWEAGVTSVSELSDSEKRLRLGCAPEPGGLSAKEREKIATANRGAGGAIRGEGTPTAFDWRNVGGRNFITPIKDQDSCGSCVAFGSAATVEGTFRVQRNDPNLAVDFSEAHLFYCIAKSQGRDCSNGWYCDAGIDAFMNPGVVDETCFPYSAGDQDCNLCNDWQNRVTRITAWHAISAVADIKTWLSTRGPLSTAFNVYNDFFSYRNGVYRHVSGELGGGHCVSVVGYDDGTCCWICKNSWGTAWGDGGFFRIAYGECGIDALMWAVDGIEET
jgi:C1A family cysteine protease